MKETINLAMLVSLIGLGCYAVCGWNSEEWLAYMAARLLARRHALRKGREAHSEGLAAWKKEIGVQEGTL